MALCFGFKRLCFFRLHLENIQEQIVVLESIQFAHQVLAVGPEQVRLERNFIVE